MNVFRPCSRTGAARRAVRTRVRPALVALAAMVLVLGGARVAVAQYFGRNHVRYHAFHYRVLTTPHFEICYYASEEGAARLAAQMAERWYAILERVFDHHPHHRLQIVLYADRADFEQTSVAPGDLVDDEGGVTGVVRRRIALAFDVTLRESDRAIGHELVHAFEFDMTRRRSWAGGAPGVSRLPRWFIDGLAEYLSRGPVDPDTAMWVRDAVARSALPAVPDLSRRPFSSFRWGQAFWTYVAGRWGDEVIGDLLRTAGSSGDIASALTRELNIPVGRLSADWQQALRAQAQPILRVTEPVSRYRRLLVANDAGRSGLNVSPSISPDGRRFLYLSRRSPLSVDLYLGDADTGISLRRLTSLSLDPRVTSLQSAASAGSWAPDNRRVVLGDEQDGRAELVIIDVDRNQVEERIPFPRLGSILAPAWSPDGRSIAFSAMDGGRSNLYLYSLADRRLRVLTRDPFGAIEPAWSPDGQRIAFVTDRLTPRVADLRLGRYRLAVIDLATGRIESLQTFATGKSVDPQWSPDGRSLLFVSDRDGISNVYRLSLADGRLSQLTNLQTGVTGLTPLSPAISVARNAPRMLFSAFQDAGNVVLRLDGAAALAGVAPTDRLEGLHAAQLPPVPAQHAGLTALERDPTLGIVPADAITEEPYTPKMSLDHIGLPDQVAVGDPIGSIVDGGVSLFWKDLAGTRTVALGLQVGSTFGPRFTDRLQNGAAALAFQDYTHRWGLGLLVQQTPHLVGAFRTTTANIDGTPVTVKSKTEFRQIYRGLFAVASYPFNDAQRLDVSAGYQNLTLDQITEVKSTSLQSGLLAGVAPPPAVPHVDAVQLMQSTVAFVSDRSVFGATSPVAGQRYRVQITMSGGTLAYEEVLADYRRYFRPDPAFTIATRIIHDGRYGPGAEDPRLLPLSVGYRELVRGYDLSSFNVNDCQPTATQSCPAIDQLLGSRTLTANVELRFPLQQAFGFGSRFFRSLPTELAIFGDAGYAWHSDEARQPFLVGPRHPVTSVGFAARVNLFGYAIGEIDLVRPFDRPHAGWMFAFGLSPGF